MPQPESPSAHFWPQEPTSGRGRSHGTSGVEPFDRWFRYPAGFASDYVAKLLDRLDLHAGTVIDCFAGSGVTGTAARGRGLNFVGIEAHPMVAELADLKLRPTADGSEVRAAAFETTKKIETHKLMRPISAETDLIQRSFSKETLILLAGLREIISLIDDREASSYLKWALLGTLRDVADVKVGWPYQRPGVSRRPKSNDVLGRFALRAGLIADDLDSVVGGTTGAKIIVGDARDANSWSLVGEAVEACVASPPYLNNFDYADATRLELFFWGTATTWREMCDEVRTDMLTATTQQSSVNEKARALASLEKMSGPAPARIIELVDEIVAAKKARNRRSKEYDQVAPAYFVAMSQILSNLSTKLKPGASALWLIGDSAPYGVYVDTPRLIGELAETSGFEMADDVLLRERGNRWGSNSDRHRVPLSERLIVLKRI